MALDYLTWWLSPGVACFLFLNVLVGAIAFTSRSTAASPRRRLCRSASSMVLDRLRLFAADHPSDEFCYYVSPEADEELKQVSRVAPDQLLAVPEPVTTAAISMMSENGKDETAAGAVAKSTSSDNGNGTCALGQEGRRRRAQESMPSPPPPPPPPPAAAPAVAVVTAETARVAAPLVRRPGPGPPKEEEPVTVAEFVKRQHRACVYAVEGKAELNARAEQFIRQFRQELKLQRLDSILGRHTNTLSTGSGATTSR